MAHNENETTKIYVDRDGNYAVKRNLGFYKAGDVIQELKELLESKRYLK